MKITFLKSISRMNGCIFLLIAVAAVIFVFSYNVVWLGDDLSYAFDQRPEFNNSHLQSVFDIIPSQNAHYLLVNGRYFAHVIVQYFCAFAGHLSFAVFNALFYVVFFILLCKLSCIQLNNAKGVLSAVIVTLLTIQTKMTPSCQIGYIWSGVFVMLFLLLFFKEQGKERNPFCLIMLALFSLIVGNFNETYSIPLSGALIWDFIRRYKHYSAKQYIMAVMFGIGTLIICLSPASQSRAHINVFSDLLGFIINLRNLILIPKAAWLLLIVVLYKKYRAKWTFKQIYACNPFLWKAFMIGVLFIIIIQEYNPRAIIGFEVFALILSFKLLKNHALPTVWICLLTPILGIVYYFQFDNIQKVNYDFNLIKEKYQKSENGLVFVDVTRDSPLSYQTLFSPEFQYSAMMDKRDKLHTSVEFSSIFNKYQPIRIVPEYLESIWDERIENDTIVDLQGGLKLLVQSKINPKKFYLKRTYILPFIKIPSYEKEILISDGKIVADTQYWRAWMIESPETFMRATKETFSVK